MVPLDRRMFVKMMDEATLSAEDVAALIAIPTETEYVDFKDGALLEKGKDPARTLRQYTTGFANGDGGLTIFGVSDKRAAPTDPPNRRLTDAKAPGGGDLESWASNVLERMAGAFSPLPRIRAVDVGDKKVLIVGVARAPGLIDCDGDYFFRIGDSTTKAPPYLIADLVLGRRAHPVLDVRIHPRIGGMRESAKFFAFEIENVGMLPAPDIVVGVIALATHSAVDAYARLCHPHLLTNLNVLDDRERSRGFDHLSLVHGNSSAKKISLGAFEHGELRSMQVFDMPRASVGLKMRSALYVVASGHPPEWYQLDWVVQQPNTSRVNEDTISIIKCNGLERPTVAWNPRSVLDAGEKDSG